MALSLDKLKKGPQPQPPRIVFYSVHGLGKSTFGADMPDPIFIDVEDGLAGIDATSFPYEEVGTFQHVLKAIGILYQEKHDYRTLVIDTLDFVERLIWDKICQDNGVESIEEIGYAKGYKFALTEWKRLLDGCDALRRQRGMSIVMLSHAHIKRFESPETEPYDRYEMKLYDGSASAKAFVQEWADCVLFGNYKVRVEKKDVGFGNKVNQGKALVDNLGSGQRVIYTEERPAYHAKNRYGMPHELPMLKDAPAQAVLDAIAGRYAPAKNQTEKKKEVANG